MALGLVAAVAAALAFGWYLFFYKRHLSHYPTPVYVVVSNAVALAWVLPVSTVLWPADPFDSVGLPGAGIVVGVVACTAVAVLSFVRALRIGEVSYVTPISKIIPVFVLPIEVLVLQEHLANLQIFGVLLATAAVYLANYRPGKLVEPLRRAVTTPAAQLALVSAAAFALVDVGRRVVLQEVGLPITVWVPTMLAGVALAMAPLTRGAWEPGQIRADLPKFVLAGCVVGLGEFVVSLAFRELPASVASPVVNLQAVVAVVLGGIVLRETHFRIRLAAAGLAVVGITLITVP